MSKKEKTLKRVKTPSRRKFFKAAAATGAAAAATIAMPNVAFYWAGDGPLRERILSELDQYDNFHWLGDLEYPAKVREYLSAIDVYALITGMDLAPLSLKEAQLMRKPVIAYIAVITAPKGRVMGHAGAIVSAYGESAVEKVEILKEYGITISKNPSVMGETVKNVLSKF